VLLEVTSPADQSWGQKIVSIADSVIAQYNNLSPFQKV
jgi:hypothetical protein